MKAVVCDEFGSLDNLRIGELPIPEPAKGELLIEVDCVGLGLADLVIVEGRHLNKPHRPFAPGIECAGTVVAAGEGVNDLKIGDRIVGLAGYGGLGQFCRLLEKSAFRVPDTVSFEQAVAAMVNYGTALSALRRRCAMKRGERLLVFGAAGGTGLAAIQIGKILGAEVTAVVSNSEKAQFSLSSGADRAFLYTQADFREQFRAHWPLGADVIFDPVGGDLAEMAGRLLSTFGRHVIIGFASGSLPKLPANHYLIKNASAIGTLWGARDSASLVDMAEDVEHVMDWISDGTLRPPVDRVYTFEQAIDGIKSLGDRGSIGKALVKLLI